MPDTYNNAISGCAEGRNAIEINGCDFTWSAFAQESGARSVLKEEINSSVVAAAESSEVVTNPAPDPLAAPLLVKDASPKAEQAKMVASPQLGSERMSKPLSYGSVLAETPAPKGDTARIEEELKEDGSSHGGEEELKVQCDVPSTTKSSMAEGEETKAAGEIDVVLRNIKLKMMKGEFIFIIGEIGSGKSSLLQAIAGDLKMRPSGEAHDYEQEMKAAKIRLQLFSDVDQKNVDGRVNSELQAMFMRKCGQFAYVEQRPWIQNGTIKDNVLFMSECDEKRYREVLALCELEDDIRTFPAGDLTEIGERGINLSGGQKARVSMARALYSDRDIYLLDDPLSALDSNVKGKIFYNCVMGRLAGKTRVLASHCIEFLDKADRILVMDKGSIVFDGPYSRFIKNEKFLTLVKKIQLKGQKPKTAAAAPEKEGSPEEKKADPAEKQGDGKIISEEEQEKGHVSFSVYKRYLKALGGAKFLILLSLGTHSLMLMPRW